MQNLGDFIKENNIKATSTWGAKRIPEQMENMDPYTVTFKMDGRQMSVPFFMGYGLVERYPDGPTAEMVLDNLGSDAAGYENNSGDFDGWCSEYGYDTDSKTAERIFKDVERQSEKLKKFLGDDLYETLLWNTERD